MKTVIENYQKAHAALQEAKGKDGEVDAQKAFDEASAAVLAFDLSTVHEA